MIYIYIRSELNNQELRCPLTPSDVYILVSNKFCIYIEKCLKRIYKDIEYENNGAILTDKKWYHKDFKDFLIIGLKEIEIDKLITSQSHLYFSHSFNNQIDSNIILNKFNKTNSILYDFEYFLDKPPLKKRFISFGFFAGFVGCALGLLQYLNKYYYNNNISNLIYWNNQTLLINDITKYNLNNVNLNIAIIGAYGNTGLGVRYLLDKLNIKYTIIEKNNYNTTDFTNYNIFYNCIKIDKEFNDVFFDENTSFNKYICIVDISCDNLKHNNPIKLYKNNTTWNKPVFQYNKYVDIISISNLPSLLPKDSSDYFSSKCCELLLHFNNDTNKRWNYAKKIYNDSIS